MNFCHSPPKSLDILGPPSQNGLVPRRQGDKCNISKPTLNDLGASCHHAAQKV